MTHTCFVRAVYPVVKRTGTRYDVVLNGDGLSWNIDRIPFIWDNGLASQCYASLCEKSIALHRAVTLTVKQTQYGTEITNVVIVPEYTERVA